MKCAALEWRALTHGLSELLCWFSMAKVKVFLGRAHCQLWPKNGVIPDVLECYEALAIAAATWLAAFNRDLAYDLETDTCGRRLVLWLCVSSISRSDSLFVSATQVAMLTIQGSVPTLDLPLSPRIVGTMLSHAPCRPQEQTKCVEERDNQRRNIIDWIYNAAHQVVSDICN
jgi:hypothetical protein